MTAAEHKAQFVEVQGIILDTETKLKTLKAKRADLARAYAKASREELLPSRKRKQAGEGK